MLADKLERCARDEVGYLQIAQKAYEVYDKVSPETQGKHLADVIKQIIGSVK